MQPIKIYPQYVLIFNYDIRKEVQEQYFRYVTGEFLPALQKRKVYMQNAWHVVYGKDNQPQRQIEFITESKEILRALFDDPEWDDLESRLTDYTQNYTMRIIKYNGNFRV